MTESARTVGAGRNPRPFNTPLEYGFRGLFVLSALRPRFCDLQRLISYDYLLVHSDDVEGAPPSLHPPAPYRGSEWLVKRDLLQSGLNLMYQRELIVRKPTVTGIVYEGSELTTAFVSLMESSYAKALRTRAAWLQQSFADYDDRQLQHS